MHNYNFLIIGGGIIGLSIALELKKSFPKHSIALIEKEKECGIHASGRNSGVLHAGFYYTANSLKARFSKIGNAALKTYCQKKGISVNTCGKLVVAKDKNDLSGLDELQRRAKTNDVELYLISEKEAQEIEPRVKTFQKALFSPTTASVNPTLIIQAMKNDAEQEGVQLITNVRYIKRISEGVLTSIGPISTNFVINAAGLYADKIALDFGFSQNYRILPFKGLYLCSNEPIGSIRTNIYPIPDLKYPFLGVHFTLTDTGQIKIGPTAIPAFWREQYEGFSRFNNREFFDLTWRQMRLLFSSSFDYKKLAYNEMKKYLGKKMVALAGELIQDVTSASYTHWGKPGIRAQLFDVKHNRLETDFVIEGDRHSLHILNAVSPAFTSALPFAQYVIKIIKKSTGEL